MFIWNIFSLSLSSLCVIYPRGRSVHSSKNYKTYVVLSKNSLWHTLIKFKSPPKIFLSLNISSLCGGPDDLMLIWIPFFSQSFFSLCNLPQRKVSTQPLVINLSSPTPSNPLIKYKFLGVKVKLGSEIRYVFQQVWGGGGGMIFYLFIVSHPLQTGH